MKKFYVLLTLTVIFLAGCSFTTPKSIKVKTKAEYDFTLAKITKDSAINKTLAENFTISSMFEAMSDMVNVYDYWPDKIGDEQQLLLNVPVRSIPVDFSSYLENLNIEQSVNDMSFSQEITVPEIAPVEINENVPVDEFTKAINSIVKIGGTNETMQRQYRGNLKFSFDTSTLGFEEIQYKTGKMYIYFKKDLVNLIERPERVVLKHNGEILAESSDIRPCYGIDIDEKFELDPDYYAVLDFTNKGFYREGMSIEIDGNFSAYVGEMKEGEIIRATGIKITDITIPVSDMPVDGLSAGDAFEECIIGDGTIEMKFEKPDTWTGNIDVKWDISISGGIDIPKEKFVNGVASLEDVAFKKKPTKINPTLKLSASNATFDFSEKPMIKGLCEIRKIKSVKVKLPEGTKSKVSESIALDESLSALKRIVLADSKISGYYWNTMPEGNDLELSCESKFLGIPETTKKLVAQTKKPEIAEGGEVPAANKILISSDNGKDGKPIAAPFPNIDFAASFGFGGDDDCIVVKNVIPGETYEIGVQVEVDFDWISITTDISGFDMGEQKDIDTGFEISSVFDSLKSVLGGDSKSTLFDELSFPELNLYVYCQFPKLQKKDGTSLFGDDIKFTGNIVLGNMQDGNFVPSMKDGVPKTLFGADGIKTVNLPILKMEDKTVVNSIETQDSSGNVNLGDILNSSGKGSLAFRCENIGISNSNSTGEITIEKAMLDSLKETSGENVPLDISIQAYVVVPLRFQIGKEDSDKDMFYLNLLSLADSKNSEKETNDLFGRDGYLEDSTIVTYLDAIESARIEFKDTSTPFICTPSDPSAEISTLSLVVDLCIEEEKDDGDEIELDEIDVKILALSKDGELRLKGTEIEKMLNTYPFSPSILLAFPKGQFSLSRTLALETTLRIGLNTDGVIPLDELKGGK